MRKIFKRIKESAWHKVEYKIQDIAMQARVWDHDLYVNEQYNSHSLGNQEQTHYVEIHLFYDDKTCRYFKLINKILEKLPTV